MRKLLLHVTEVCLNSVVCLFGLCNAPSVFMMFMDTDLTELGGFACAHIDDIENVGEHIHAVLDH